MAKLKRLHRVGRQRPWPRYTATVLLWTNMISFRTTAVPHIHLKQHQLTTSDHESRILELFKISMTILTRAGRGGGV